MAKEYVQNGAMDSTVGLQQVPPRLARQNVGLGETVIGMNFRKMLKEGSFEEFEAKVKGVRDGEKQSYYDKCAEQFKNLFAGSSDERVIKSYSVEPDTVKAALNRLLINGQSYAQRYSINPEDIDENNYEMVVCDIMQNLTSGEVARSFQNSRDMQVTVLAGRVADVSMMARPVVPPFLETEVKEPEPLGFFKRNLSRWGFFKEDVAKYNVQKAAYDKYQERLQNWQTNTEVSQKSAESLQNELTNNVKIDPPSQEKAAHLREFFSSREKRQELQDQAKDFLKARPLEDVEIEAQLTEEFGLPPMEGRTVSSLLAGMGRPGSIRSDLYMYMMAYGNDGNGMTLEEAMNAPKEEKQKLANDFSEIFFLKKGDEATDRTEKRKDEMGQVLAKMCLAFSKESLPPIDLTDPETLKNGARLATLSSMGMDLGQLFPPGSLVKPYVEKHLVLPKEQMDLAEKDGLSSLDFVKRGTLGLRSTGEVLDDAMKTFAKDGFVAGLPEDSRALGRATGLRPGRLTNVAALALYNDEFNKLANKPCVTLTKEEIGKGMYVGAMCASADDEAARILRGEMQTGDCSKMRANYVATQAPTIVEKIRDKVDSILQAGRKALGLEPSKEITARQQARAEQAQARRRTNAQQLDAQEKKEKGTVEKQSHSYSQSKKAPAKEEPTKKAGGIQK